MPANIELHKRTFDMFFVARNRKSFLRFTELRNFISVEDKKFSHVFTTATISQWLNSCIANLTIVHKSVYLFIVEKMWAAIPTIVE
jgi:hypothetical protein